MNRDHALRTLADRDAPWDIVIIGGGATGLGAGVDAAARGYATLVLEQHDFAKGTSSRSTKLIHGGVRYLAQGRLGLVYKALHERELLLQNAPHLVQDLKFVIPAYSWWELPYYFVGLSAYDLLAGRLRRGRSRMLSHERALQRASTLIPAGLKGGILYHDCQFDDARLNITLARTLFDCGGMAANYVRVTGLLKDSGKVNGVRAFDLETDREFNVRARVVVNATGPSVDRILRMDNADLPPLITPSQGIHVVLNRSFLPGDCAIVVPHTDDARVLFAIPWQGKVILGTTDTRVSEVRLEPRALDTELSFLLEHAGRYLVRAPQRSDVLSVFAGLRPLVGGDRTRQTAAVSRDHHLEVADSGLVTIAGGKWTTYRHMGEQVIDCAARVAGLPVVPCRTESLRLHGWRPAEHADRDPFLDGYGADVTAVRALMAADPSLGNFLHPRLPYREAQVIWGARQEMGRTVEDILARRTRALLLDARASLEAAPLVARLLARELGRGPHWIERQVSEYSTLATGYLPG